MKTIIALVTAVMFVVPIVLFNLGVINNTAPHIDLILGFISVVIALFLLIKYKLWEDIFNAFMSM